MNSVANLFISLWWLTNMCVSVYYASLNAGSIILSDAYRERKKALGGLLLCVAHFVWTLLIRNILASRLS